VPRDNSLDHTPNRHWVRSESGLQVCCNHNGYGLDNRWRFTASEWPSYKDRDGNIRSVAPSNLREPAPATEAADSREYRLIAKQIVSKLLTPYRTIYADCAEAAAEYQEHADSEAEALAKLQRAAGQHGTHDSNRGKILYGETANEDSVRIEFRSKNNVLLTMTAEQAAKAMEALR
jgi:hypothetical protein